MLSAVRRNSIVELLNTEGELRTEDLASQFAVSIETIRRDLRDLEHRGAVRRIHGGAMPIRLTSVGEAPYRERSEHAYEEKELIARSVVETLTPGSTIFLDFGTTIDVVVRAIPRSFEGTFFTTSIRAAFELAHLVSADVHVCGGQLRKDELCLSGPVAIDMIRDIQPDVAVISCGAVDASFGVTDYSEHDRHVKRAALQQAKQTIVVADSTKFGRVAPYKVCAASEPTAIISTTRVSSQARERLVEMGAKLHLAQ